MAFLQKGQAAFLLDEYKVERQRVLVGAYLLLISILLIGAFIGRQDEPMNVKDTKLNETQQVGFNSMMVKMTDKTYNEKQNFVEMTFEATGSKDKQILTGDELKITGKTIRGTADLVVIPTINNQWTIIISNLDEKFGAIELTVESLIPNKPGQPVDKTQNKIAVFKATQKHMPKSDSTEQMTPKTVALSAVQKGIKNIDSEISELKKKNDDSEKLIAYNKEQIKKLQSNTKTMTTIEAQNTADTVVDLQNEIASTQDYIKSTKEDIKSKSAEKDKMLKKEVAIKNDNFKFSEVSKTQKMEPKSTSEK